MQDVSAAKKMVPIAISEFLNGMTAPADLYLRMGSGKHVLVFKSGTKFEQERLKNYLDKSVTHLWVQFDELKSICDSAVDFAQAGISQKFLDVTKKAFLLSNATASVYRSFESIGIDLESYNAATKTADAVLEFACSDFDMQSIFDLLQGANNYLAAHAVATSILAPVIGQEMGIESPVILRKLALGGLLHDIGKAQIPVYLLEKPYMQLNADEIKEYQLHCLRGAEMLKGLKLNSEELTAIVYQHHERNDGSGYPQRLKGIKIHPLAKIVGLASEFLNMVMPNPRLNNRKYTAEEAIDLIHFGFGQPFDKEVYDALSAVVVKKVSVIKAAA